MERFRDYLDLKLGDRSFHRRYYKECAICPITTEIIRRIEESPKTLTEIAQRCQVSESIIVNLREADDCCVESVKKIAGYFGINPPKDCLKDEVE